MNYFSPPVKVLVVDDHRKIRETLAAWLRRQRLNVITADNATSMWSMLRSNTFNLIVLDVMLPDGDGMLLCQQIQRKYKTPVILLTAKDDLDDRVSGLEMGADDYVVKPFEPRELLARIHTVLRRAVRTNEPQYTAHQRPERVMNFSGLIYRPVSRTITNPQGTTLKLSTVEARLLTAFLSSPGSVLSREVLMDRCITPGNEVFDRAIDRQVSRLRNRLQQLLPGVVLLDTVWGEGYRLVSQVEAHNECLS
ncbi:OmpR family transcriptional regulatory protein [Klebsiella quasipneumoniae]|uniref:response regulator transcription factor n=1 Tax=Klebsiella pneumoniae complex TaxID=3390273 RepID=UPI000765A2BB|nr:MULTISPECIES: response regulator transcription factor [Klebsiella]MCE0161615.1 response regulator transcription factor [Klebsiella variicola subsp. variicola]NWO50110.1 response regulator transcription factor [Klebsiella pneumoniae]VGG57480.1 OmpR family transcriptional regulatory protein [Klebsiella quasipneumoniae]HBR1414370.1 response regulator transcription factor [Klebsiella pneumoniae]HBR1478404.1 response regulator transcription factor [Klebsiella pneumoniae]